MLISGLGVKTFADVRRMLSLSLFVECGSNQLAHLLISKVKQLLIFSTFTLILLHLLQISIYHNKNVQKNLADLIILDGNGIISVLLSGKSGL